MRKCKNIDCFAYKNGKCNCLIKIDEKCSFYKTKEKYEYDCVKAKKKLIREGKSDIYSRYNDKFYGGDFDE